MRRANLVDALIKRSLKACIPAPWVFRGHIKDPSDTPTAVVTKYQKRISGSLPGRIDIHVEVLRVDYEKLSGNIVGGVE